MEKVLLQNDAHIFQMLGDFDDRHGYGLPKDIAEALIKLPKKPIASEDEIDVGTNVAFLRSDVGIDFCLEDSTLFLVERATEMGGLIAFTYLTPLTEITLDYFKNLDVNVDLAPIKERIQARRIKRQTILAEHERLALGAMRRARKILTYQPLPDFDEAKSVGKRFIRKGKPDYNTSQLQLLAHIIDKGDLLHPVADIIGRWQNTCNNKASALLLSETTAELHVPQIPDTKKANTPKGKTMNFQSILAAMTKRNNPQKQPVRLKPSKKATEILTAETEIEDDFMPESIGKAVDIAELFTDEEKELQKLVTTILAQKDSKQSTTAKTSLKGKKQGLTAQRAPASSNHERAR
jgi:hypothetical protein